MINSKTIKVAAATGIIAFLSLSAQAQGFYAKLGGGYNFGLTSYLAYSTTENIAVTNSGVSTSSMKFEPEKFNLGQGSTAGGALGYMFNKNIGFEVGINFLNGHKNIYKSEKIFSGGGSALMPSSVTDNTSKSQMVLIQPALVLALGLQKFNPYTRIGFVVAKGSIENTYSYSDNQGNTEEKITKDFGGTGFGLQTALGLNFNLNEKLAIFTEGTVNNLTYTPEKGEVTKLTWNGQDLLSPLKTSQKEIKYEDEATFYLSPQTSPSEPRTEVKQRNLLHSLGLNVGLKYNF